MPTGGIRARTSGIMVPAYVAPAIITSYQGPGNIIEADVWYGLRAYKSSIAGSTFQVVRLRSSGGVESDFGTVTSGGVDTASIASFMATNGSNCTVAKLYNQSTANSLGLGDVTQANSSQQPAYGSSGFSHIVMSTTGYLGSGAATSSRNQPFSFYTIANNNSADSGGPTVIIWGVSLQAWTSPNDMILFAGVTSAAATVSDDTYHAVGAVFNSAASDINVDGTTNTVDPGTNGAALNQVFALGLADGTGSYTEGGLWLSALSGSNMTALSTNAHGFWGF